MPGVEEEQTKVY